jgi:hypothetical protein
MLLPALLALSPALSAQSLGLADLTLGTPADTAATTLYLGHSISFDVAGGTGGEVAYLLASGRGPAVPIDLGGVPVIVDPLAHVVLGVQPVGTMGQPSFPFTVPPTMAIGNTAHAQVFLLDLLAGQVRATNGLALSTAGEPLQTFLTGSQSGHPLASSGGAVTITSDAEWQAFWAQHTSYILPPPPAPSVDFGTTAVVCAFAGWKPSSGYSLGLDSIVYTGTALDLAGTIQKPGAGCGTLAVITYPFHFALVDAAVAAPAQLGLTTLEYTCG